MAKKDDKTAQKLFKQEEKLQSLREAKRQKQAIDKVTKSYRVFEAAQDALAKSSKKTQNAFRQQTDIIQKLTDVMKKGGQSSEFLVDSGIDLVKLMRTHKDAVQGVEGAWQKSNQQIQQVSETLRYSTDELQKINEK